MADELTMDHASRSARRKRIADFIAAGGSLREATAHFGVSESLVRQSAREYGVIFTGRMTSDRTFAILADCLNTDDTLHVIGDRHGVAHSWVCRIAKKAHAAGIRLRRFYQGDDR